MRDVGPAHTRPLDRRQLLRTAGLAALGVAGGGLVLSACGDESDSDSTPASTAAGSAPLATATEMRDMTYVTPFGFLVGFAPVLVADSAGFFEQHGLNVHIEPGSGSAQSIQQVIGGQSLLSRTGGLDLITATSNEDAPIKSVGVIAQGNPFNVISNSAAPLNSPADMAGKTIGVVSVGGGTETILDMMLQAEGIDPAGVGRETVGNAPTAFALVQEGRVDAFIASVDTVEVLRLEDAPIHTFLTDEYARVPGQVYFAPTEEVDGGNELITAFLASVRKSVDFIMNDRDADLEATLEHLSNFEIEALANPEAARAGLNAQIDLWLDQSEENILRHVPEHWEEAQAAMMLGGAIDEEVPAERLYTNEFVDQI